MKNNKKKTLKGAESLPPVIAYNPPTYTNHINQAVHESVHDNAYRPSVHDWNRNNSRNSASPSSLPSKQFASGNSSSAQPKFSTSGVYVDRPKQRNSVFKLVGDSDSKRIVLRNKNFNESFNAQSNEFSELQNEKTIKNSGTYQKDDKTFLKTYKNNIFDDYNISTIRSPFETINRKRSWAIVDVNSLYGKKQKKNKKKNTNKLNYLKNSVRKMF